MITTLARYFLNSYLSNSISEFLWIMPVPQAGRAFLQILSSRWNAFRTKGRGGLRGPSAKK